MGNTTSKEVRKPTEKEKLEQIDLAELVERERIKTIESLKASIEALQERVVSRLEATTGWSRSTTTYTKEVVTMLGRVRFRVVKVRRRERGRYRFTSPILDVLSIRGRRYSREVKMVCADLAATTSYGEASKKVLRTLKLAIPKRTIHSFVQEIGTRMARRHDMKERHATTTNNKMPVVVMGDGTKTHSIYPTNNDVRVAISYSTTDDSQKTKLLGLAVNRGWETIPRPSGRHVLVSDGERGIVNNLASGPDLTQLDLVHAEKDAMFRLWGEGMPKEQRDVASKEMNRILFALVNSVKKHKIDGDMDAIERRVESTLSELKDLAESLLRRGFFRASEFISRNARLMVTFAKLAVQGIDIPYTSNAIERLMGAIARRCKHGWMHWSTKGLERMLWILLVRYTDEQEYESFWQGYIHPLGRG
jgi:hypothetical protein